MDFKSSYDEVPAELVHTPEQLHDTALAIRQLTEASYPQALELLKGAMARQTGDVSAETLFKEAKALLGELLSEPEEIHMLAADADSERAWLESLRRELAGEMMPALEQVDREWLEIRALDLARAIATFWWNLAPKEHQRRFSLGDRILDLEQIEQGNALASLGERFGLNVKDAHALLRAVQEFAVTQRQNDWTTISPEDYQIDDAGIARNSQTEEPKMANPQEQLAAWQNAASESTLTYAQASIASAEQLLNLNLEAARNSLEQAGKNTRELLSISDPQELVQLRAKIAQTNMQQTATYAQNIYEIVSQTQALLTKLAEEQFSRLNREATAGAEQLTKGAPGADVAAATVKSTLAATNAMIDNLNRAAKQFAELSEASIKTATAGTLNSAGEK